MSVDFAAVLLRLALAIEAGCQHPDADDLERDDSGDLACGDCRATWAESSLWAY